MSKQKDGGPAFPVTEYFDRFEKLNETGMTLRDWFAGKVISGLLENKDMVKAMIETGRNRDMAVTEVAAASAYDYADAMLAVRDKVQDDE